MAGQDLNQVIEAAVGQQKSDQESAKAFMWEDVDFHQTESDFKKQVVYIKYHEAAEKLATYTQTARTREMGLGGKSMPKQQMEPIEMAKY